MPSSPFAHSLLADYAAAPDNFDEMLDAAGVPRAHWRAMLAALAEETPDHMRQRMEMVQHQVRENGVTYNALAEAEGRQRAWELNVLPLILPDDEWRGIEAAVIQRATLLNRILGDIYGAQDLLREGLLPPALVHGNPGFLRPCHGMPHVDGVALHFYAVDLARAPDGRWWVVADRTQGPSGAGYALENRAIMTPIYPDLMRELKVQSPAGFFRTVHDSLVHWGRLCAAAGDAPAPLREGEMPLIVLLSPGASAETYHEQAYLARYLGLTLVQGDDLTVRKGVVYLKTLDGLQRVHVVVRQVDDCACDPLELQNPLQGQLLGVAGLTHAAMRGNVVVANSLGSSLIESDALLGFLPAISERLLGEPLKMPSVATWWCGEPAALETVIARLDQLVIKPGFSQLPPFSVFGQDLAGDARTAFIADLRARPNNYIAQEVVRLSQAPVWTEAAAPRLKAHAIGLRVFACATPDGYAVMPGGLTRVATGPDARVLTIQKGGASKDTWVQGRAGMAPQRLQKPGIRGQDLVREDTSLPSRVAEDLLWFGRHTERCDNICRLLRVALNILFNVRFQQRNTEWPTVEALCVWFLLLDERPPASPDLGAAHGETAASSPDAGIESALLRAVVSPAVPGLARQQERLHQVAGRLHERFSLDNWRALNRIAQPTAHPQALPSQSEVMTILDDTTAALMTLAGFALDGMTRDLGWRFMSIGRHLERLQFQCVVLQRALAMDGDGSLDWLLELSDSIITYRVRYRTQPEWLPVLDLLLCDETNPRSILFQVHGIQRNLHKIAQTHGPCGEHLLAPLNEALRALRPDLDLKHGNAGLNDLLERIQHASAALYDQLSVQFFSYTDHGQQRNRPS